MRRPFALGSLAIAVLAPYVLAQARFAPSPGNAHIRSPSFVENRGQAPADVLWQAQGAGFEADFLRDGFVLRIASRTFDSGHSAHSHRPAPAAAPVDAAHPGSAQQGDVTVVTQRISFPGGNPQAGIEALDPLPGKLSFILGNDPKRWARGLPSYARLRYSNFYPGIDLLFYSNQGVLEYDFMVSPGSDPGAIRLRVEDGQPASVTARGELQVGEGTEAVFHRPWLYQNFENGKRAIEGKFFQVADRIVAFDCGAYDKTRPLVIDPTLNLLYSTYLGGYHDDGATAIALDAQNNAYILGESISPDYPVTGNAYQPQRANPNQFIYNLVITKFSASGTVLYSTFLGGSGGDTSGALVLDASGNAYLTGLSKSTDFPVTAGAYLGTNPTAAAGSAVVAELSPDGSSLLYSTFFGPSSGSSVTLNTGIALHQGNLYFAGSAGPGLATTPGAYMSQINSGQAAFVAVLNLAASGPAQLVASTYYGAATPVANSVGTGNLAFSMALDNSGNPWITGLTYTNNLPVTSNALQGSLPALSASCQVGGANLNSAAFLAKLSANLQTLLYGSYFSGQKSGTQVGGCSEYGRTVALDSSGNIYLTGETASSNFPTTSGVIQPSYPGSGSYESFISKFNPTATQVLWSTYFGGNAGQTYTTPLVLDSQGNPWVGTTTQGGSNFPISPGAYQTTVKGGYDGSVTELSPDGTKVLYSTYIGGSLADNVQGLAIDSEGNAYITGVTTSTDFPVTPNALETQKAGGGPDYNGGDIFFTILGAGAIGVITPSSGGNTGDTSITISGSGFQQTSTCALVQGTTTIQASAVTVSSNGASMTCTFALIGAPVGNYNVVVTTPNTAALTLQNAFAVLNGGQPQVWANVISRPVIRTGLAARFLINVGNAGTVNTYLMPLWIHLPPNSTYSFPGGLPNSAGLDYGSAAAFYASDGSIYMPFIVGALPVGQTITLPIDITATQTATVFEVDAYTDLPWFGSLSSAQSQIAAWQANLATLPAGCLTQQVPYLQDCLGPFANDYAALAATASSGTLVNGVFHSDGTSLGQSQALVYFLAGMQQLLSNGLGSQSGSANSGAAKAQIEAQVVAAGTSASPWTNGMLGFGVALAGQYSGAQASVHPNCTPSGGLYACGPAATYCQQSNQCQNWTCQNGSSFTTVVEAPSSTNYNCTTPPDYPTCPGDAGDDARPVRSGLASLSPSLAKNPPPGNSRRYQPEWFGVMPPPGASGGTSCGTAGDNGDPNDKGGSAGDGSAARYVNAARPLSYIVAFENESTATLPVQQAIVTDPLDPTKVDLTTLTLGAIAFGSTTISLPSGTSSYNTLVNINSSLSVRIQGSLDPDNGVLKWTFTSIDPTTGLPPADPTVGFLPPDTDGVKGQGSVEFNIIPKSGLATGTQITNTATVIFDENAPINTPAFLNTIDSSAPASAVTALPASEPQVAFNVAWSGSDAGAGVGSYDVYVSDNGGPFARWQTTVSATSAMFTGQPGHTYGFYSIATDRVGNVQAAKSAADTTTAISASAPGFTLNPTSGNFTTSGGNGTVTVTAPYATMPWTATSTNPEFVTITSTPNETGNGTVGYTVAANTGPARSGSMAIAGMTFPVTQAGATGGMAFYPVTPCRVADTRNAAGQFGGPIMSAGSTRSFAIPSSACNIPAAAQAYSLNVTVVPPAPLGYLTIWPTGQPQPYVSTLNSSSGAILANAAIVPAGTGGAVSVYVSDATHTIIDINGYFAPPGSAGALAFYPVTPCRVADTRNANGPFGGPSLAAGGTRSFTVPQSACNIPSAAQAYSLNMTAVPPAALFYLTMWPAGQTQPVVSTLNDLQGNITANAAIVPAGTNGAISVFVSDATNVLIDINGYFAPPGGTGALYFYPVAPCRIADTRNATGTFGGPQLGAGTTRNFPIPTSSCGLPSTAQAYSLNMTVVPPAPLLYLSTWPAGQTQPVVSTLNDLQGQIVANAAIVPGGSAGGISVFVSDATNLVIDINGYFGQ